MDGNKELTPEEIELYNKFPWLKEYREKKCRVCGRRLGNNPYWNLADLCSRACCLKEDRLRKK